MDRLFQIDSIIKVGVCPFKGYTVWLFSKAISVPFCWFFLFLMNVSNGHFLSLQEIMDLALV